MPKPLLGVVLPYLPREILRAICNEFQSHVPLAFIMFKHFLVNINRAYRFESISISFNQFILAHARPREN